MSKFVQNWSDIFTDNKEDSKLYEMLYNVMNWIIKRTAEYYTWDEPYVSYAAQYPERKYTWEEPLGSYDKDRNIFMLVDGKLHETTPSSISKLYTKARVKLAACATVSGVLCIDVSVNIQKDRPRGSGADFADLIRNYEIWHKSRCATYIPDTTGKHSDKYFKSIFTDEHISELQTILQFPMIDVLTDVALGAEKPTNQTTDTYIDVYYKA